MNRPNMFFLAPLVLALVPTSSMAAVEKQSAFHSMDEHYEAIWTALSDDHIKGVKKHALAIEKAAATLVAAFDTERAGVSYEKADVAKAAMPMLRDAAKVLSSAESLEAAREAFYALSKPMVRYRSAVGKPDNMVVYCSMANKSWLQPHGAIGNPYYGKSMLRCGDIVSK